MIFPYILLLLIIPVYTDGTPHQPDTRLRAKTGENVTLSCEIDLTSADIQSIFWIRMKQPKELQYILGTFPTSEAFTQHDGLSEHRYKAIKINGTYNLHILNVQDSDSGIYYCSYHLKLVMKFGSGTSFNYEESESRLQDSIDNTTACDISSEKETLQGYVAGLGVALSMCVAVMIFLITSLLRRPAYCAEGTQNQTLPCNNSVLEETQESNAERINYAALDFSKHKGKKNKELNKSVVYSDVRTLFNEFNNERFNLRKVPGSSYLSIANILSSDEGSYFCAILKLYGQAQFGKATYLIVEDKDHLKSSITDVIQAALPGPVHPGHSETLECVVLSESRTEDLRVFWFRPTSGGSHPGVIYTNKSWTGPCEGRCVYSLPKKDVNISDAGTYYCGIATSGQILFGSGTPLVVAQQVDLVLVGLAVALSCCVAAQTSCLVWLICKMRGKKLIRDKSNTGTSDQAGAAEGLNYAALSFSKKDPRGRRAKRELPPDPVYSAVNL
ncbi:uncharacterized protein LOC134096178 [Sardina pilchardus]|uniref:uncharacterized protein LOC134096178 n=1 Tax=Sardina pilchardus TaxID=27697 RepID=UPI002E11631F